MVTRLSQLFVRTLREDPSDAEVASHRLLVRAGYIRRQAPGIFAWLPLGLRVRRKVEQVIHDEMERAGAQHVHFPALLPREPYEVTGRWTEYGDGIFRLKDRKDADYLLAPTHEEVFTLLVKWLTMFQLEPPTSRPKSRRSLPHFRLPISLNWLVGIITLNIIYFTPSWGQITIPA